MYDALPPKGICSESCDLLKFWEIIQISDNISLTVHYRGIVVMEH